jgi:tetratricopeptide (TPR) repeat protein
MAAGEVHLARGRFDDAIEAFARCDAAAAAAGAHVDRGHAALRQAFALRRRGDVAAAEQRLTDALARFTEPRRDEHGIGSTHAAGFEIAFQRGDARRARVHLDAASEAWSRAGATWQLLDREINLGELARMEGRLEDAVVHYRQALRDTRAAMSGHDVLALNNLGFALLQLGRAEQARSYFEEAVLLERWPAVEACVRAGLVACLAAAGQDDEAHLGRLEADLVRYGTVEVDVAIALAFAAESSDGLHRRRLAGLAAAQYRALGREAEAEAVAGLARVDTSG